MVAAFFAAVRMLENVRQDESALTFPERSMTLLTLLLLATVPE